MASASKPVVFVIMPFREEILALYNKLKEDFANDYEFTNAGDLDNQRNILHDIVEGIGHADIIIADLTGLNSNVFYELGLAHALNKKVIIITQDINELPFDIKSYRAIQYSLLFYKLPALLDELKDLLRGAIDGSVKYGSPVSDYLPDLFIGKSEKRLQDADKPMTPEDGQKDIDDSGEDGFLDHIAGISDNSQKIQIELQSMSDEMNEMSSAIDSATNELSRVKAQSGGSADANFIRNVCRKVAGPIESVADSLKSHISNITNYWSSVENGYLDLLDNPHTRKTENIGGIQNSLEALRSLQTMTHSTDVKIEGFISALGGSLGMERKLSKAISLLVSELQTYLSLTSTMSSSIDRIISKGKIVITQIESQ